MILLAFLNFYVRIHLGFDKKGSTRGGCGGEVKSVAGGRSCSSGLGGKDKKGKEL